jgi:hypothetical protein
VFLFTEEKGTTSVPPQPARHERHVPASRTLPRFCSGRPLGPCFVRALLHSCFFSTIPFRIRTSDKRAHKPRRIRSSKTRNLKSFRIRIYKKTGEGVPLRRYSAHSEPVLLCEGRQQAIHQAFAARRRQWTRREITGTLLDTRRVSPRARPPFPAIRIGSQCSQSFPFPSPITNRK